MIVISQKGSMIYKHGIRDNLSLVKSHTRGREVHESIIKPNSLSTLRRKTSYFPPNVTGGEMNIGRWEVVHSHRDTIARRDEEK